MLKRTILLAMTLVVVLGAVAVQVALADETVPEFRLSDVPDGPAVTDFAAGIRSLFAIFRYQDASATSVTVRLVDTGGVVIFEHEQEYTGSGQETIEITGQMVYQNYYDQIFTRGAAAGEALDAALAASGQMQVLIQIQSVVAEGIVIRGAFSTLSQYPLDSATRGSLTQGVALMDAFVDAGMNLAYDLSEDELHNQAQQMKADLDAALQLADQAWSTGGDGADFSFPGSPTGQVNIAQLAVGTSLVQSIEWTVAVAEVEAELSPTPTNTAWPTPTPTSTSSAAAAPSATPRPTRIATATQTPVPPTSASQPGGYPGPTVTVGPSATPAGPTPTLVVAATSPATQEPGTTPAVPVPVTETPAVAAQEGTKAITATPIASVTEPAPQRRATPTPEAAAPGTGLPLGTVGALAGAVILGLVALWFRRQM